MPRKKGLSLSERFGHIPDVVTALTKDEDENQEADRILQLQLKKRKEASIIGSDGEDLTTIDGTEFGESRNETPLLCSDTEENLSSFDPEWDENFQSILKKTKAYGNDKPRTGLFTKIESALKKSAVKVDGKGKEGGKARDAVPKTPVPKTALQQSKASAGNVGKPSLKEESAAVKKCSVKIPVVGSGLLDSQCKMVQTSAQSEEKAPSDNQTQSDIRTGSILKEKHSGQTENSCGASGSNNEKAEVKKTVEKTTSEKKTPKVKKGCEGTENSPPDAFSKTVATMGIRKNIRATAASKNKCNTSSNPNTRSASQNKTADYTHDLKGKKLDDSAGLSAATGSENLKNKTDTSSCNFPLDQLLPLPLKKRKMCESRSTEKNDTSVSPVSFRRRHTSENSTIQQQENNILGRPLSRMARSIHLKALRASESKPDKKLESKNLDSQSSYSSTRELNRLEDSLSSGAHVQRRDQSLDSYRSPLYKLDDILRKPDTCASSIASNSGGPSQCSVPSTATGGSGQMSSQSSFGFYKEINESRPPQEKSAKESEQSQEELCNLLLQQCYGLVQTEEDQQSLLSVVNLIKEVNKLKEADCNIPDTTSTVLTKSKDAECEIASNSPNYSADELSSGSKLLFEGRTLLKGGVKPRHIPKCYIPRPDREPPKDPRTRHAYNPDNKRMDIKLPNFAKEVFLEFEREKNERKSRTNLAAASKSPKASMRQPSKQPVVHTTPEKTSRPKLGNSETPVKDENLKKAPKEGVVSVYGQVKGEHEKAPFMKREGSVQGLPAASNKKENIAACVSGMIKTLKDASATEALNLPPSSANSNKQTTRAFKHGPDPRLNTRSTQHTSEIVTKADSKQNENLVTSSKEMTCCISNVFSQQPVIQSATSRTTAPDSNFGLDAVKDPAVLICHDESLSSAGTVHDEVSMDLDSDVGEVENQTIQQSGWQYFDLDLVSVGNENKAAKKERTNQCPRPWDKRQYRSNRNESLGTESSSPTFDARQNISKRKPPPISAKSTSSFDSRQCISNRKGSPSNSSSTKNVDARQFISSKGLSTSPNTYRNLDTTPYISRQKKSSSPSHCAGTSDARQFLSNKSQLSDIKTADADARQYIEKRKKATSPDARNFIDARQFISNKRQQSPSDSSMFCGGSDVKQYSGGRREQSKSPKRFDSRRNSRWDAGTKRYKSHQTDQRQDIKREESQVYNSSKSKAGPNRNSRNQSDVEDQHWNQPRQNKVDVGRKRHVSCRSHFEENRKKVCLDNPNRRRYYSQQDIKYGDETKGLTNIRCAEGYESLASSHQFSASDSSSRDSFESRSGEQGKGQGNSHYPQQINKALPASQNCPENKFRTTFQGVASDSSQYKQHSSNQYQQNIKHQSRPNPQGTESNPTVDPFKEDREFLNHFKMNLQKTDRVTTLSGMNYGIRKDNIPPLQNAMAAQPFFPQHQYHRNLASNISAAGPWQPGTSLPAGGACPTSYTSTVTERQRLPYGDSVYSHQSLTELEAPVTPEKITPPKHCTGQYTNPMMYF